MSGAEEAGGGGPTAGPAGAVPAGVGVGLGAGVGAAAGPAAAALGEAAGPGLPDEAGLAGARQLQEAASDPDAPPKKRLRAAEAAEAAAEAALRAGMTWQEIADALGVSRQAAHKKHSKRVDPSIPIARRKS